MATFWIGTSGYNYREWRGSFYPTDVAEPDLLKHYAARFPTVELNYAFYRMPTVRTLQAWAKDTPDVFHFSLKAPRRITHDLRLRDAADPLAYFCDTSKALKRRLGALLFQLPPFLKQDVPRLEDFLHQLPPGYRVAFEFRNPSWFTDEVYDCLRRFDAAMCVTEHPDRCVPFEATASFGYLRLRRSDYADGELQGWAHRLLDAGARWSDVFVYFKQEDAGKGPHLAARLAQMVGHAPASAATAPHP